MAKCVEDFCHQCRCCCHKWNILCTNTPGARRRRKQQTAEAFHDMHAKQFVIVLSHLDSWLQGSSRGVVGGRNATALQQQPCPAGSQAGAGARQGPAQGRCAAFCPVCIPALGPCRPYRLCQPNPKVLQPIAYMLVVLNPHPTPLHPTPPLSTPPHPSPPHPSPPHPSPPYPSQPQWSLSSPAQTLTSHLTSPIASHPSLLSTPASPLHPTLPPSLPPPPPSAHPPTSLHPSPYLTSHHLTSPHGYSNLLMCNTEITHQLYRTDAG